MAAFLDPPLSARRAAKLEAILVGRVSDPGPGKQDLRSLDDQEAQLSAWLASHTDLPTNITVVAGSGSGELLERSEYLQLVELVESERYDLVLTEDLGRIVRRIHAHLFCEHCADHDTRLISLNDPVDTAREGWQDASIFSAWHHERSNRDTSARIKRTHRNRFDHGGCAAIPIYGIVKCAGAGSDADWQKDPAAEDVYRTWFKMLDDGALYAEVADWLNQCNVPTGRYHRKPKWDGTMVAQTSHNMLLKGYRYRNKRKSRRNSAGKYISVPADPQELRLRHVPHLAFFDADYYDRVIAKVDARNGKYRRTSDELEQRPTGSLKRSRWPGKHLVCKLCRYKFVWGGHGQTDRLMCDGCRHYHCWQAISVDGPLASEKIIEAVFKAIESLPGFDSCMLEMLQEEAARENGLADQRMRAIEHQLTTLRREIENVVAFIRGGNNSTAIREELERAEFEHHKLEDKRQALIMQPKAVPELPPIDEIKRLARSAMERHADDPTTFAKLMRDWIPRIVVAPYRLFEGGQIVLRASFQLNLVSLVPEAKHLASVQEVLSQQLQVDLFDPPNQRDRYREQIIAMKVSEPSLTYGEIAAQLGITKTAVQRAFALQRSMDEIGLTDPYIPVLEPPDDFTKLRRHKSPRYKFQPKEEWGL